MSVLLFALLAHAADHHPDDIRYVQPTSVRELALAVDALRLAHRAEVQADVARRAWQQILPGMQAPTSERLSFTAPERTCGSEILETTSLLARGPVVAARLEAIASDCKSSTLMEWDLWENGSVARYAFTTYDLSKKTPKVTDNLVILLPPNASQAYCGTEEKVEFVEQPCPEEPVDPSTPHPGWFPMVRDLLLPTQLLGGETFAESAMNRQLPASP